MNTLRISIAALLLFGPKLIVAGDPAISLEQARRLGQAKSRLLNGNEHSDGSSKSTPIANLLQFENSIKSVLLKSCLACHGPKRTEGRLRIDRLNPNLLLGPDVGKWREVYHALSNSEMPPEDEPEYSLADAEREKILDWLSAEMNKASLVRRHSKEHSSFRRLTKYEYNYVIQDLLGLPYSLDSKFSFTNKLPPETASEDGFKNSSELLQMSASQFETYREIGRIALNRAIVHGARPQPVTYVVSMQNEFDRIAKDKKKVFDANDRRRANRIHLLNRKSSQGVHFGGGKITPQPDAEVGALPVDNNTVLAMPRSSELKMNLDRFLPDDGIMRVRIRAWRSSNNANEFACLRLILSAHTSNNANFAEIVSQRDMPVTGSPDKPQIIDFYVSLGDIQRNPFRHLERTFPRRDEFLHIRNESNAGGKEPLQVYIDHVEISAPFYAQWPPKSHTDILLDSKNKSDEQTYGREVLTRFMRRVWRRSVTSQELDQLMALFTRYRASLPTFEQAMVEVMATALASPEFLYLTQRAAPETNGKADAKSINDFELASRLSFFLWSSIPDDELLTLAEQGRLSQPDVMKQQVIRLLNHPRSQRFAKNFVHQWLGLDGLDSVTHIRDASLRSAMKDEPVAFFSDLLKRNGSVLDFISSDYLVINQRLASHYHIPNVFGPHFRRVPITPQSNRGGILTNAAVLAMNSDGKDSHPLKRGVWMLERILHDPPPPPPPNVPEVDLTDPEILKMTLKERIADHRNKPACRSCHSKIDPWGIAFENYDALGAFRTKINQKPVDATSELFNRQKLDGMDGLKRYLLMERQDQFANAMVHKMTSYALGRSLSFSDHADIDSMAVQFRKQGDRLGDLVHLIASSRLFRSH